MKQTIYIAEDNRMMREFLLNLLSSDYELFVFDSVQKVQQALATGLIPDLILLDYSLNGGTGHDLLSSIRTDQELNHIPVIFLSGEQKSDIKIQCLADGADDFINKPFNPVELKLRLSKLLNSKKSSSLKAS